MPVLSTLKNTWNEMSSTEKFVVAGFSTAVAAAGGYYYYNKRQQQQHSDDHNTSSHSSPFPLLSNNNTKNNDNNSPAFFLNNNNNRQQSASAASSTSFDEGVDGRYISTLTELELAKWLCARGLPRSDVDALCVTHHVDGAVFVRLTPELVDEMKLPSIGGRVRLGQLVMRCRESFHSQPPTPRRVVATTTSASASASSSPLPPWRAATHSNAGSIQRAQQEAGVQQQNENGENGENITDKSHVLTRLIDTFKTLSNAEFIRYAPDVQRRKIADAQELLQETEQYLLTLPADKAAPFTEVVGRFKLLISLLTKQLEALSQGGSASSSSSSAAPSIEIIKQSYERLARATHFIQSEHFRGLAQADKSTVLDQAAKMYEELVQHMSQDQHDISPELQKEIVPELLKIQQIITRGAQQLGGSENSNSGAETTNAVRWNQQQTQENDDQQEQEHDQPPEGGLHDVFNFFTTEEFMNLPTEEKRKHLSDAERRLVMMIQASLQLPEGERTRVGPAIERLSRFLGELKNHHLTQAQRKYATAQQDAKEQLERQFGGRGGQTQNDEEDEENDATATYANVRASVVLLRDVVKALGSDDFLQLEEQEQIDRIAVAEKTHRQVLDILDTYSEEARRPFLPVVDQLGKLVHVVKEKVMNASPATRARRGTHQKYQQEQEQQPASAAARTVAAERQGVQAPSRHHSPPDPRVLPVNYYDDEEEDQDDQEEEERAQMEKQAEQAFVREQAREQRQQQQEKQSEETQRELKSLFEVFRFMGSASFDSLPLQRKVEILRTAKLLLETQLERVESTASETERAQLAPILERMVDILANVNQLVSEQNNKEQEEQQQTQSQQQTEPQTQEKQPLFLQALKQLSMAFSILSHEDFNKKPLEQQREVTKEAQRLVFVARQLLDKEGTAEEKEQYGSVLSRMADALGLTSQQERKERVAEQEEQEDDEKEVEEEGQLAKSVEQLLTIFKMIVSEDFSPLPDEKKQKMFELAQQLMEHNIRLLNSKPELKMVSADEKERYGPIVQQVAETFKKLGLLDKNVEVNQQGNEEENEEENEDEQQQQQEQRQLISIKEPMSRLVQVFQLLISDEFQKIESDEQKLKVISLVKSLADVNQKAIVHGSEEDKKTFGPMLKKICDALKKLGILDESSNDTNQQEQQEQQEQQQQESNETSSKTIALKEPMSKLVQVFQMIVSDEFQQLPEERKIALLTLVRNLADVNKKAFPHGTAEDKKTFAPIFKNVLSALKQLGIIDDGEVNFDENETAQQQQEKQDKQDQREQEQEESTSSAADGNQEEVSMAEPMTRLLQVFKLLVSEQFSSASDEQKLQILTLTKRLAESNVQLLSKVSKQEREKFGPVLERTVTALKKLGIFKNELGEGSSTSTASASEEKQEQQEQQQEQEEAPIAMAEPLMKLAQTFQLLVSENFQTLSEDQKKEIMNLTRRLALTNIKLMPGASKQDQEKFKPVMDKLISSLIKIGLLEESEVSSASSSSQEQQQKRSNDDDDDAPTAQTSTANQQQQQQQETHHHQHDFGDVSIKDPVMRIVQMFQIIVSESFGKLPTEQQLQVMKMSKDLTETVCQIWTKAPLAERKQLRPIFEKSLGAMKKLSIVAPELNIPAAEDDEEEKKQVQSQQQQQSTATSTTATSTSTSTSAASQLISMEKPMKQLINTFQIIVSDNFSQLADEKKLEVMGLCQQLATINKRIIDTGKASEEDKEKYSPILDKIVSAMKRIGLMKDAEDDQDEDENEEQKQEQQQESASASAAKDGGEVSIRQPVERVIQLFQIIVSDNFSKLEKEQQLQVMTTCKDLTETVCKIWSKAPAAETERLRPVFEQAVGAFKKLGIIDAECSLPPATASTSTSTSTSTNTATVSENTKNERELAQAQQQKRHLEKQIEERREASQNFEALSALFNDIGGDLDTFQQRPSAERRAILVKGLTLIEKCARHLQTVPADDREALVPVLSQMQSFFKQMAAQETGLAQEEAAAAVSSSSNDQKQQEDDVAPKYRDDESGYENESSDDEEEEEEDDELRQQREGQDPENVRSLNQLITVMKHLTNPNFADLPSQHRKQLLQQGKLALMDVHKTITAEGFPADSRERIAPLVQKFATLIQAVAQAEQSVAEAEGEGEGQKEQDEQKQQQESSSSTGTSSVPAASVERLMELYRMIVSPNFQQMPLDVQARALSSVTELANVVKDAVQEEQNPALKSKIENFLNRVDEVVTALTKAIESKKKLQQQQPQSSSSNNEQENDEEGEEAEDEDEEEEDEEAAAGEAELATQLDALLDIIRSKDTLSAIQEGGPRRVRVLQVVNDVISDCQSQINNLPKQRGEMYQSVLDQIAAAKGNLEGVAVLNDNKKNKKNDGNENENDEDEDGNDDDNEEDDDLTNPEERLRKRDNMLRAREVSRNLGVILEALNSDRLLAMPDTERNELLGQIGQSIQVLKEQAEMLDDAEKQALLPTLAQVEGFVSNIAKVSTNGAVSQVLSERIAREQEEAEAEAEEEENNKEQDQAQAKGDDESSTASNDPPPKLSSDDAIRTKLLGQLQRIDDVISSPSFATAPMDVRRQTARAIYNQLKELRTAAQRLLNENDLESFENDTADIVSRLQELTSLENDNNTNNNDNDDDQQQQQQQNGGREAGQPAPEATSELAVRIMKKAQQFFAILNAPAFTQASDDAKAKIATEILQQAKTMLQLVSAQHEQKLMSDHEQEEIRPILVGIVRMCRAIAEPEGEERDEETESDDDEEQQQQQEDDRSKPLRGPSTASAASNNNNNNNKPSASSSPKSRSISQQQQATSTSAAASPSPKIARSQSQQQQQQQQQNVDVDDDEEEQDEDHETSDAENDKMTELLTIAKMLQTPNISLPEDEIASIAERVEEILTTDLQNWRTVPELKSLVRFITAQLARHTQEREQSVQRQREESQQRRSAAADNKEAENDDDDDGDDRQSEPYSESDEKEEEKEKQQQNSSSSTTGGRTALEQRLYNLLQQLIAGAQSMSSESDLAPFVTAIDSLEPSRQNFTESENRLFGALQKQVSLIRQGLSHVEEVPSDNEQNEQNDIEEDDKKNDDNEATDAKTTTTTPAASAQNGAANNKSNTNNKPQPKQQQQQKKSNNKKKRGGRRR